MAWRLARSLVTLRSQIDEAYPGRSKASDGTISDAAHSGRASDHNKNADGVVCGLDLTHDPGSGFDAHELAERLRTHRHPNLKYIISNRRIASALDGWRWRPYTGVNPHNKHIHVSVGAGPDGRSRQPYDNTTLWDIGETKEQEMSGLDKTQLKVLVRTQYNQEPGAGTYSHEGETLNQWLTFVSNDENSLRNRLLAGETLKVVDGQTVNVGDVVPPTQDCSTAVEAERNRIKSEIDKIF